MEGLQPNNCDNNCTLATKSQERLNAAFSRIDEIRIESKDVEKELSGRIEKLNLNIQERVKNQLFIWIVGVHIAITGSLMGIMWSYFMKAGDITNVAIDRMEDAARDNAQDIKVALTRIDDYIYNHNEAIKRTEKDQVRIIDKLDKIETSVKDLQIGFGTIIKNKQ